MLGLKYNHIMDILRDHKQYGQNGSGKTAVIDAMYFLQKFMTGESIEKKLTDYINLNYS